MPVGVRPGTLPPWPFCVFLCLQVDALDVVSFDAAGQVSDVLADGGSSTKISSNLWEILSPHTSVFGARTVSASSAGASASPSGAGASPSPSPAQGEAEDGVDDWVFGVIGGVCGLVLICAAGVAYFFVKRQLQRGQQLRAGDSGADWDTESVVTHGRTSSFSSQLGLVDKLDALEWGEAEVDPGTSSSARNQDGYSAPAATPMDMMGATSPPVDGVPMAIATPPRRDVGVGVMAIGSPLQMTDSMKQDGVGSPQRLSTSRTHGRDQTHADNRSSPRVPPSSMMQDGMGSPRRLSTSGTHGGDQTDADSSSSPRVPPSKPPPSQPPRSDADGA